MLDQFRKALGHVHSNAISTVCILVVLVNSLIDSQPHNCFHAFLTVHIINMFENKRIAQYDVSWTLWICYKHIYLQYCRSSFSFWCVFDCFWPSTQIRYVHVCQCVCIFVLIYFQERFQLMCFSMKMLSIILLLVWTDGLNTLVWMRTLSPIH